MGYAKFFEDNERITTDRKYEREIIDSNIKNVIYYDCYYCDKSFESLEKRNKHIKEKHSVVGPLILINGKILSDSCYVDEFISAKIILCGFNETKISLNQKQINHGSEDIDLIPFFKAKWTNYEICIDQRTCIIKKFSSENISNKLVNEIINTWEKQVSENENKQLSNEYPDTLNEAERRYLNGFFDYFTGCKTTDEKNKRKRYEDASAALSSFNQITPKAIVLLKVIAYRFNWIERLRHLSKETNGSAFDSIVHFFYGLKPQINSIEIKKENEQKFFVEDEIAESLKAIIAFQNENFVEVDEFLEKWTDLRITQIKDTNKKDRIFFLKARRMNLLKRNSEAIACYDAIKTPFLKKEAEKYII